MKPSALSWRPTTGAAAFAHRVSQQAAQRAPSPEDQQFLALLMYLGTPLFLFLYILPWLPSVSRIVTIMTVQGVAAFAVYFRLARYVRKSSELPAKAVSHISTRSRSSISTPSPGGPPPRSPISAPPTLPSASVGQISAAAARTSEAAAAAVAAAVSSTADITAPDDIQDVHVNPFVNLTWKIDETERIRLTWAAVSILPVRALAIILLLLVAGFWAALSLVGVSREDMQRPLPQWRRTLQWPIRLAARTILFAAGYYWIPTKGRVATPREAPIVIANHTCMLDPIFMVYAFLPAPVAAGENVSDPLFGTIVRAMQAVLVDRRSADSKRRVIQDMVKRCQESHLGWPQICVFPEGTTGNGKGLITFKNGAFIPGQPVQPVAIRFPHTRFDPSWVAAGPSVGNLVFRMLCEPVNRMEVEYMDVYTPSEEEKNNPFLYARNVQELMAARLGVQATQHRFEDVLLQQAAVKAELPPEAGVIEYGRLDAMELKTLNLDTVKKHLDTFRRMDRRGKGTLNLHEFIEAYGVTDSPEVENLFHLLDADDSGEIDFREYLMGLGLVSELDEQAMFSLAFRMFDIDNTGRVKTSNLRRVFDQVMGGSESEVGAAFASITGKDSLDEEEFKAFAQSDPQYMQTFRAYFFGS